MSIFGDLDPREGAAAKRPEESSEYNKERNKPQAVGGVENVSLEDPDKVVSAMGGHTSSYAGRPPYHDEWDPAPQPSGRTTGLL